MLSGFTPYISLYLWNGSKQVVLTLLNYLKSKTGIWFTVVLQSSKNNIKIKKKEIWTYCDLS